MEHGKGIEGQIGVVGRSVGDTHSLGGEEAQQTDGEEEAAGEEEEAASGEATVILVFGGLL